MHKHTLVHQHYSFTLLHTFPN